MAWRVDIDVVLVLIGKAGFLGEDRNAFSSFIAVVVEKRVFVIDAAERAKHSTFMQNRFRQGGLAAIDMGVGTDNDAAHLFSFKSFTAILYYRKPSRAAKKKVRDGIIELIWKL